MEEKNMKMKKMISLISSFAIAVGMFASFATVSYATEETPASIEVSVDVDEYGYYYVDLLFSLKDTELGVGISKTERGFDYYSGTGIQGVTVNIKDLPDGAIYGTQDWIIDGSLKTEVTNENRYYYTNLVSAVESLAGSGTSANIVRISTDFNENAKTKEEVKEMFSNFGYVAVKVVTATDLKVSTDITQQVVTYAISAPGEKHVDADYSININPTAEEPTPAATATVLGDHTGDKETEGDEADTTDKAVAILGTPAAPESRATSLVWTVTPNTGDAQQFTQVVDVEGGATYKFGLVLRNITEDLIKTVSAVLQ